MNERVPEYVVLSVTSESVAVIVATVFGVGRALRVAGWPARERRTAMWIAGLTLSAWFSVSVWLSRMGAYRGTMFGMPTIPFGVLLPIVAGVVAYRTWPAFRRVVEALAQEWMIGIQVFRVLGFVFLVLCAAGRLPGVFAWPAGLGDVVVGLSAVAVSAAYARQGRRAAGWVLAWNLLGITDLVVALTTGFLSSPGPLQRFALEAPNELIGVYPLVLIPVFLVPFALLLHFGSLRKLGQSRPVLQVARGVVPSH